MTKLHAILAAEKNVASQATAILTETERKFKKREEYFIGYVKNLNLLSDDEGSRLIEKQNQETKELITNVHDTLDYALKIWANSENLQFAKNRANQKAEATVDYTYQREDGTTDNLVLENVPVDELMGLEKRLTSLRETLKYMPVLDANKKWEPAVDISKYVHRLASEEVRTKTKAIKKHTVVVPATDKHAAQVAITDEEVVIGSTVQTTWSGSATTIQKAEVLDRIDGLITAVRQAKSRANDVEVEANNKEAEAIVRFLMEPLR